MQKWFICLVLAFQESGRGNEGQDCQGRWEHALGRSIPGLLPPGVPHFLAPGAPSDPKTFRLSPILDINHPFPHPGAMETRSRGAHVRNVRNGVPINLREVRGNVRLADS